MYAPYRPAPYARLNNFHGPKRQLLGNQAGYVPPAWRVAGPSSTGSVGGPNHLVKGKQAAQEPGSKIFLSRLPTDVGEKEVEELFKKTVGPLKESFLIYNSQGLSKGMAIVAFQRPGDAALARSKYDGKIVDGRRPIRIEIIVDSNAPTAQTPVSQPPSLFSRLAPVKTSNSPNPVQVSATGGPSLVSKRFTTQTRPLNHVTPVATQPSNDFPAPIPPRRYRQKKGPRRLNKKHPVHVPARPTTKEQLDREMEDYRASADLNGLAS